MKNLLTTLLILSVTTLFGGFPQCGQFELSAEFIYFKPQIDDPFFVWQIEPIDQNLNGEVLANDVGFCPGFRVGLEYGLNECCDSLFLRYTYLNATHTESVSGFVAIPQFPLIEAGTARSRLKIEHQAADFLYNHFLCKARNLNLALQGGLHFSYFDIDNRSSFKPDDDDLVELENTSCTYGIGPQVGLQGQYCLTCLPCVVTLRGSIQGAILATRYSPRFAIISDFELEGEVSYEPIWHAVPYVDIRAGLHYPFYICSYCCSLEIGYEFITYWKGFSDIDFSFFTISPQTTYSDVTYQGPFLSLAVRF